MITISVMQPRTVIIYTDMARLVFCVKIQVTVPLKDS